MPSPLGIRLAESSESHGNVLGPSVAATLSVCAAMNCSRSVQGTDFKQLRYSQVVILNFNGLSWPHVSVATLKLSIP